MNSPTITRQTPTITTKNINSTNPRTDTNQQWFTLLIKAKIYLDDRQIVDNVN